MTTIEAKQPSATNAASVAERSNRPKAVSFEDHAFVGEWLSHRLSEAGIEYVANIDDPKLFVPRARASGADLVILDVSIPNADPFAACAELTADPDAPNAAFLSASTTPRHIRDAISAGAIGYLSKSDCPDAIVAGLRNIAAGRAAFTDEVIHAVPDLEPFNGRPASELKDLSAGNDSKLNSLTDREREVLVLIGQGLTRADIAAAVSRSPKTIDKHRSSVMQKLGIHDRAQLVLFAVRSGLVAPTDL